MEILETLVNAFIILIVSELSLSVCVNIVKIFRCRVAEGVALFKGKL